MLAIEIIGAIVILGLFMTWQVARVTIKQDAIKARNQAAELEMRKTQQDHDNYMELQRLDKPVPELELQARIAEATAKTETAKAKKAETDLESERHSRSRYH